MVAETHDALVIFLITAAMMAAGVRDRRDRRGVGAGRAAHLDRAGALTMILALVLLRRLAIAIAAALALGRTLGGDVMLDHGLDDRLFDRGFGGGDRCCRLVTRAAATARTLAASTRRTATAFAATAATTARGVVGVEFRMLEAFDRQHRDRLVDQAFDGAQCLAFFRGRDGKGAALVAGTAGAADCDGRNLPDGSARRN